MQTLLIDNGSTLTKKLALLSPGDEDIVSYDNIPDDVSSYSLIILSGSSKFPVEENSHRLAREIELIQTTNVPVIGICLGHEIIAHTFGAKLEHFAEKHVGMTEVNVLSEHEMFQNKETFAVYENHQYGVTECSPELEVLAKTNHAIAVLKHKTKEIYGFQFHPEHHEDDQFGDEVFLKLFQVLAG